MKENLIKKLEIALDDKKIGEQIQMIFDIAKGIKSIDLNNYIITKQDRVNGLFKTFN